VHVLPALFSSLSYSSRCAIYQKMVVDKQCWYETYIVPAHKNNIAVFSVWLAAYTIQGYHRFLSCVVRCEDLAAEERSTER